MNFFKPTESKEKKSMVTMGGQLLCVCVLLPDLLSLNQDETIAPIEEQLNVSKLARIWLQDQLP